ncbi:MAG: hypothetical protein AB7J32_02695 [Pseudonocardia sp.]
MIPVPVAALVIGAVVAGCGGPSPPEVPVPTFPAAAVADGVPAPGPDDPGIPDDCGRIMAPEDLVAVLGLPLGSVAVRTVVGVPEPSVGRVERVACRYTGIAGRVEGVTLLEVNAGRYVDGDAAARQWTVNVAAVDGPMQELRIGTAPAVVRVGPESSLLSVVYSDVAVTLALPPGAPDAPGHTTADTLSDLAVRVLANLVPAPPAELRVSAR